MDRVVRPAIVAGLVASFGLAALIWIGTRRLAHFDAALVAYTAAVLFATFSVTYRHAVRLQRPPTAMHWRRAGRMVHCPGRSTSRSRCTR